MGEATKWFYAFNGAQQGPVTADELFQLLKEGKIDRQALAWTEGQLDWQPILRIWLLGGASSKSFHRR